MRNATLCKLRGKASKMRGNQRNFKKNKVSVSLDVFMLVSSQLNY